MKIGFFGIEGWEKDIVSEKLTGHDLYFSEDKIDDYNLPEKNDFDILSIFIDSRVNETTLKHFPNLKFVATRSTGFDHIDSAAAKRHKVLVSHVPGYGEHTVAEFTFGLMLSLTRNIFHAIDRIKESGSFTLDGLRGTDLNGKTLGVIGTGRIGSRVIRIAREFGMNVIATDPYPNKELQKEVEFKYVPLEELLSVSDIITCHCPYNKSTHHLINKENIGKISKGTLLVNTSRGAIIETEALTQALKDGTLGGAALDVLEEEGEIKDELSFLTKAHPQEESLRDMLYNHILMDMPNVLITPHTAFNSQEALEEILETTLENIEGFIKKEPINLIPGVK